MAGRHPPVGIVIDTRARIGYTAPVGSTDESRVRHLTVALPPQYAARLFDAQQAGEMISGCSRSPCTHAG